MNRIVVVVPVR